MFNLRFIWLAIFSGCKPWVSLFGICSSRTFCEGQSFEYFFFVSWTFAFFFTVPRPQPCFCPAILFPPPLRHTMATCCERKEPLCSKQRVHRAVHTFYLEPDSFTAPSTSTLFSAPSLKKTRPTFELTFTFLDLGLRRNLARRKQHLLSCQ